MYSQKFVLDTTAFTNATSPKKSKDVLQYTKKLVKIVADARVKLGVTCYIPYPMAYNELVACLKMRDAKEAQLIDLDTWFIKKTPNRYEVKLSSEIFYEYIGDIRERMNKGLRLAEDAVKEASRKKDHAPLITILRDKYKSALREGVLDSREDLDVLLLAKELNAGVVTADEGMIKWAEKMGLEIIPANRFPKILQDQLDMSEK
ncbi:MAG: RNA ligase partner protein [archaeon]